MEIFARLFEIFPEALIRDLNNPGYRLFLALHEFCRIAYSFEILEEELPLLDKHARTMLRLVQELEGEENKQETDAQAENQEDETLATIRRRRKSKKGTNQEEESEEEEEEEYMDDEDIDDDEDEGENSGKKKKM